MIKAIVWAALAVALMFIMPYSAYKWARKTLEVGHDTNN